MNTNDLVGLRYPPEVLEFCSANGLVEKLDLVVEIVNETFPEAESVTLTLEQDQESQHRWVLVDALVKGTAQDIRLRHRACVHRLLKALEWPASTLIRTTYTLA